jgi:thiol:disulfide interchange protein/DsbC/DsbD-like thiol-disulfide interchange protein
MLRSVQSLFFLWALISSNAAGEVLFEDFPHSKARLIATHTGISDSEPTYIALQILLDPEWHTYWKNPGDSGAAPIFTLTAPEEVTISSAIYPLPQRFDMPPLTSIGYDKQVFFLFQVDANPEKKPAANTSLKIKIDAEWLVCKVECVPAIGSFEIDLLVDLPRRKPSEFFHLLSNAVSNVPKDGSLQVTWGPAQLIGDQIILNGKALDGKALRPIDFFPVIGSASAANKPDVNDQDFTFKLKLAPELKLNSASTAKVEGLALLEDSSRKRFGVVVDLKLETSTATSEMSSTSSTPVSMNVWKILGFAFLGGLLLNLMPCVFPVISIKLFSILQEAHGSSRIVRRHCLAYVSGVVLSFLTIGIALVALRAGGTSLGWGFQLQSPTFVAMMCVLFVLMAFSFLGFFDFNIPVGAKGSALLRKDGWVGQFFTGVLSTVVASPCTAPFMGFAMGAAVSQSYPIILATFAALGLGLASPYFAFMISPSFLRLLPKPGAWMETLKQFMAFPMLATCLWLLWLLGRVSGSDDVIWTLTAIFGLSLAVWIRLRVNRPVVAVAIGGAVVAISLLQIYQNKNSGTQVQAHAYTSNDLGWVLFSDAILVDARASGKPVFVNFTADWCITCKVNERVTFYNQDVIDFVKANSISMIKADWTRRDPAITAILSQYDRIGVPLYLFFKPGSEKAHILPEVLTPNIFTSELNAQLGLN